VTNDDAGSGARAAPAGTDRQEECLDRPRDPLPTRVESCPPLPAAYSDALDDALAAGGLALDDAARTAIDGHVRMLLAWSSAINLTSVRDPAEVAVRHVADSLTALDILRDAGIDGFLDLGSGGGFPGIPLAAAIPSIETLLIDSVGKKARFLGVAAEAIGLAGRVRVGSVRAEGLAADDRHRERWPALTARAFPLLLPGGLLIAWKRGDIEAEVAGARRAMDALGGGAIEVRPIAMAGLDGHCLVLVRRGRGPVPAAYPRDPAVRRRRPW
jgi:16S rRNA (guanine527-N7)-methyltransferase